VFCKTGSAGGYWGVYVGTVIRFALKTKDAFDSDKIVFYTTYEESQVAKAAHDKKGTLAQVTCEEFCVVKNLPEYFASGSRKGQAKIGHQWSVELRKVNVGRN
jgi:hypothetical protein